MDIKVSREYRHATEESRNAFNVSPTYARNKISYRMPDRLSIGQQRSVPSTRECPHLFVETPYSKKPRIIAEPKGRASSQVSQAVD